MIGPVRTRIVDAATLVAILLSAAVAFYSLFLVLVGMPGTLVQEVPEGEAYQAEAWATLTFIPHPASSLPLLAASAILVGLVTRRLVIAWIGLLALFAFSALLLFSVGAPLLPVAGLILVLLLIIQRSDYSP